MVPVDGAERLHQSHLEMWRGELAPSGYQHLLLSVSSHCLTTMHTALESVLEHLLLFFIFPQFLGHMFVVVNMVLQVAGCLMILIRKYVTVAVGMLFGIILLQVCRVCLVIGMFVVFPGRA